MKSIYIRYRTFGKKGRFAVLFLISFLSVFPLLADNEVNESPLREEIQRYIGYEDLLPKYLSLPYDAVMNTNLWGAYVDMSFLLLLFLPLLFLFGNKERPWMNIAGIGLLLILLIMGVPTSYSSANNIPIEEVGHHLQGFIDNVSFSEVPSKVILAYIYQFFNSIYQIAAPLLSIISGESDYITYPLLFSLFLVLVYLINARIAHHPLITRASINILTLFSFLWLILSAGIPWYGFFILPLGIMFMVQGWSNETKGIFPTAKIKYYSFLSIVTLWLTMAFTYRAVNYAIINENSSNGLLFSVVLQYGGGQATDVQMLRAVFPQYEGAIQQMNQEEKSRILRVGTFFPYFIKKNDKRVITDNQLGYFDALQGQFSDPYEMAQAMKLAGFKYIIVDLNTGQIDKTPEKSLQRKYRELFDFIYQNKAIKLIATDQLSKGVDGKTVYSIYGQEMIKKGTFAVFEII